MKIYDIYPHIYDTYPCIYDTYIRAVGTDTNQPIKLLDVSQKNYVIKTHLKNDLTPSCTIN